MLCSLTFNASGGRNTLGFGLREYRLSDQACLGLAAEVGAGPECMYFERV